MTPSFLWHAPARNSLLNGERTPEECRLQNFILEIERTQTIVSTNYTEIEVSSEAAAAIFSFIAPFLSVSHGYFNKRMQPFFPTEIDIYGSPRIRDCYGEAIPWPFPRNYPDIEIDLINNTPPVIT
jgi:hypothetical protein